MEETNTPLPVVYNIREYTRITYKIMKDNNYNPNYVIHTIQEYALNNNRYIIYDDWKFIADIMGYSQKWAFMQSKRFNEKARDRKMPYEKPEKVPTKPKEPKQPKIKWFW